MRILVVEDEITLSKLITQRLKDESYSVDSCFDGQEALGYFSCAEYDVVVLDILLPKLNGLEFLSQIRAKNDKTPVILLTAMDAIEDRVNGLNAGADDYLVKPFAFDELIARIRVLTRRNSNQLTSILKIADLVMDTNAHTVHRNEKLINLSSKEFSILEYLLTNQGIVISRDKINQHMWDYDYDGGSNIVDVYIRYLRKKIDDNYPIKLIHTVRGVGYVLRVEL